MISNAVNYLSAMLTNAGFWDPYRFLNAATLDFTQMLNDLRFVSLALIIVTVSLELTRQMTGEITGRSLNLLPLGVYAGLLSVLFTVPSFYLVAVKTLIAVAHVFSMAIHTSAMAYLEMEIDNLFTSSLLSTQNPVSQFIAILEVLTPLGLLSVLCYWLVLGALFILPLFHSLYVTVFVLLGPLLIPFALWAPTRSVARSWLMSLLASAFITFFGIIAYTAISLSGILTHISLAKESQLPSIIFSLSTLAFLLTVPWFSFRIFGAITLSASNGAVYFARMKAQLLSGRALRG